MAGRCPLRRHFSESRRTRPAPGQGKLNQGCLKTLQQAVDIVPFRLRAMAFAGAPAELLEDIAGPAAFNMVGNLDPAVVDAGPESTL